MVPWGRDSMNRNIRINIGEQRFYKLREENSLYIDKTEFIREWWETGVTSTLITRPRRFGKTLNMSMLECFFSNEYEGRSDLFEGLSIWENGSQKDREKYHQLQGTYPVIFLSFAEIKAAKYEEMTYKIKRVISDLYEQNRRILEGTMLGENEKEYYKNVNSRMKDEEVADTIRSMAHFMKRYYDKDVIILLDEYDTPMQEAWLNGYWDQAVQFFRGFLGNTFKTNPYLQKGIITGITRISMSRFAGHQESIFSDLERFYHGLVLGLMVELADRFQITSNRESGFGRYDIMLKPADREKDCAYIIEFKVHKPKKEKSLEETVANALSQIAEKQYETALAEEGFAPGRIRKYGFAFKGKECLIG